MKAHLFVVIDARATDKGSGSSPAIVLTVVKLRFSAAIDSANFCERLDVLKHRARNRCRAGTGSGGPRGLSISKWS